MLLISISRASAGVCALAFIFNLNMSRIAAGSFNLFLALLLYPFPRDKRVFAAIQSRAPDQVHP